MWLYWCLLSTVISGFTSIAMKKCSNNEQKRLAIMGLFSYHSIMIIPNHHFSNINCLIYYVGKAKK